MWERNGEDFYFDEPENSDIWQTIVCHMKDNIRESLHRDYAPCTKRIFLERYLELDPDFEYLLAEEFCIEWK